MGVTRVQTEGKNHFCSLHSCLHSAEHNCPSSLHRYAADSSPAVLPGHQGPFAQSCFVSSRFPTFTFACSFSTHMQNLVICLYWTLWCSCQPFLQPIPPETCCGSLHIIQVTRKVLNSTKQHQPQYCPQRNFASSQVPVRLCGAHHKPLMLAVSRQFTTYLVGYLSSSAPRIAWKTKALLKSR